MQAEGWPEPVMPVIVGGMSVAPLTTAQWIELMLSDCRAARAGSQPPRYHGAVNGNAISNFATNASFRNAISEADAIAADGVPVMWAARHLAGCPIPDRAATTDLFHDMAMACAREGFSIYFLGSTPEENAAALAKVRSLYPDLIIAGAHHGYFKPEEEQALVARIMATRPDIVLVALGVPREDEFVVRNRQAMRGVGWIKTCGGLFNFLSGSRSRAPNWMQQSGLEWLYRMSLEPRRLFWRYTTTNVHAVWRLLRATPRYRN